MDLGGSGDLRVLVRRFMWVVWAWIWGVQVIFVYWCAGSCGWFGHGFGEFIVFSVAVGSVIHEPKTRPSLSRAHLREVTPTPWEPPHRFSVVVVSATGGL